MRTSILAMLILCPLSIMAGSKGSRLALQSPANIPDNDDDIVWALPLADAFKSLGADEELHKLMDLNSTLIFAIDPSEDQAHFKTLKPYAEERLSLDGRYVTFKQMSSEDKKQCAPDIKKAILASNQKLAEFIRSSMDYGSGNA